LVDADDRGDGPECSHNIAFDASRVQEAVSEDEIEEEAEGVDDECFRLGFLFLVGLGSERGYQLKVDEGVLDESVVTVEIPAHDAVVVGFDLEIFVADDTHLPRAKDTLKSQR
jgi:hypothetical protein